jgi:hypothetical protein
MLRWIRRFTAFTAVLVAVFAIGIAFLLLVGAQNPYIVVTGPQPAAIITILASTLIILGIVTKHLEVAWIGDAFLVLFGVIFILGIGIAFLIVAGVEAILLGILQSTARRSKG